MKSILFLIFFFNLPLLCKNTENWHPSTEETFAIKTTEPYFYKAKVNSAVVHIKSYFAFTKIYLRMFAANI